MPNICELSIHFSLNVTNWWIETLTFSKVLHTLKIKASKTFIKEEERQYYDQHLTRFLIDLDKNWSTNWKIVIDLMITMMTMILRIYYSHVSIKIIYHCRRL